MARPKRLDFNQQTWVRDDQVDALRRLAHLHNDSVAALVRVAIDNYIRARRKELEHAP
jgi:hypothetical protein